MKHIKSSPYHPSSNGLAERAVQTVKAGLKKINGNLDNLARYRVTPQATTGRPPSEFVLPSTWLDLLRPSIHNRVLRKQEGDKERRDQRDSIWEMNFLGQPKWVAAVIENRLGPLTFSLRLQDNRVWKRHQDHLRKRRPIESTEERLRNGERQFPPQLTERDVLPRSVRTPPQPPPGNSDETRRTTTGDVVSRPTTERSQSRVEPDMVVPLRRSHSVVKAPDRLDL